jgi:citrate synthase
VAASAPQGQQTQQTLTVTDNRTGRSYDIPIENGAVRATAFRQVTADDDSDGLVVYDPAYLNTASCTSRITFVDGDKGILRYRGYPIEQLAEHSNYLEVAYLLIHGELPDKSASEDWLWEITHHTFLHENVKKFIDGFHHDAHPMGMLVSTVAALSTFYPAAKDIFSNEPVPQRLGKQTTIAPNTRRLQMYRLIAKMPTIAAYVYRHAQGFRYSYPDNELSFPGNFMGMLWKTTELKYEPDPNLERALDVLFILHADHEQNCSTSAMRTVGSSHADPFSATAAAAAALYGPLHGGANEAVVRMLLQIGTVGNIPNYIDRVKRREIRLQGFGHRVYKNYDPRATIIKRVADEVFEVTGRNPLIDIALELERIALSDEYFVEHKLYPNVDFYSGIIYQAMGFPLEMFPVLFAIPRVSGWLAHWEELILDSEQKIHRPRQIYLGPEQREYVPRNART